MSNEKIIGGTGITAGGNVTFDNISGQVAFGENITQIINQDGTKSWLYAMGFRPSTDPNNIFGRQEELVWIDEFFKQNSALAIIGFRGTGKSTLASMYIDIIQKRGDFAGIYWRKLDENIDIRDVVGSFFTVIGKPILDLGRYKVEDLINLFFIELNAASYFLVLDNFEVILDLTNKPKRAGFSDFIEKTKHGLGKSRILFTSWECPMSERGIRPKCHNIGGLDTSAAVQLLRRRGIKESYDELKEVIELSGGHPLAMLLLVQLIEGEEETLSSILKDKTLWIGEVAENILDKVYDERLSDEERKLLQYVSLYRLPVPVQAIVIAANDVIWTEANVKKIAVNLKRKSLLQKTGEYYWEESLIENYAYNKLVDKIERHKSAFEYYILYPLPDVHTKKEDIWSLIEAHYHVCMAKEYDTAGKILFDFNLLTNLKTWGNFEILIDLCSRMMPKNPFQDRVLLSNLENHGAILGYLGEAYQAIGKVRESLQFYKYSLLIYQKIGNKLAQSMMFGNLGGAYHALGEIRNSIEFLENDLKISQEIGYIKGEGISFGNLGCAYQGLGEVGKAILYYEKALKIVCEIGDKSFECLCLGNLGSAYMSIGQMKRAIECYEKAIKIAREDRNKPNECKILGNLGTYYMTLGESTKAIESYEKALKIALEIGCRKNESLSIGNLGILYKNKFNLTKAFEYLERAINISHEIEDRHDEGIWLGNLGLTYALNKDVKKSIEYLEKALNIAEEISDRKNEGIWLGNIGLSYNDFGERIKAIVYYVKALKISQEVGDKLNEGTWINNIGNYLETENQYKKALACYYLAKNIRIQIDDPYLWKTNFDINRIKEYLGEKKFDKLTEKIEPKSREIVNMILEDFQIESEKSYG
jgi:tetratricopeptide (TPR) repeat protein